MIFFNLNFVLFDISIATPVLVLPSFLGGAVCVCVCVRWNIWISFFFKKKLYTFWDIYCLTNWIIIMVNLKNNISGIVKWLFFNVSFFFFLFLINHPFYTHQCIHVNPNLPIHHTTTTTTTPAAFPPWCPYVCSLHLCLNFCPAYRFICTIFLGSIYMR